MFLYKKEMKYIGHQYLLLEGVTNVLSIESPYGNGAGGWMPGVTPPNGSYLSFAKNRIVNNNNLLGYHGLIKFVNNSKEKVELFSVGSILTESSK